MPKSSTAISTPSSCSRARIGRARAGSATTMLSVISSTRRDVGTAQRWHMASMRSGRSRSISVRAERFTATPMSSPCRAPRAHLAQRVVEDVVGQRDDQARVLGQRDELVGRQPAVHGVRPAQQHLGAGDHVGAQVDLGLVVQDELLALERRAQVAGQRQALDAVAVELGHVALDAGPALLGLVHGDVGALHEHVDVLAVLGVGGDADAGAELQAHAGHVEVRGDGAPHAPRRPRRRRPGVSTERSRIANSSPPRRATVSSSRSRLDRRAPTWRSTSSP